MARKPFKKNLTPLTKKGVVNVNAGKGATEQRMQGGQPETLTGRTAMNRAMDVYPKPQPKAPMDILPQPTAMAPPGKTQYEE